MYSEYTALFTHSTQRTCTVSCIIYTLYNVNIDSQLYFGIILHYIQNACKNKSAVYTLYIVQPIYCIFYIRALRNKPFIFLVIVYLPSKDQRVMRALVK